MTLIYWGGFIICIWYFGHDIIYKENPHVVRKAEVLDNPPYVKIDKNNIFFAVRVEDWHSRIIEDERFFKIRSKYYEYVENDKNELKTEKNLDIPMSKCTTEDVDEKNLKKFKLDFHSQFISVCIN